MARKPTRFHIRRSDRVVFVGATGSGKTTLAKSLLWGSRPVYILDPKRTFTLPSTWPNGFITIEGTNIKQVQNPDIGTFIIRPSINEITTEKARMAWANVWLWYAFNRGSCIVYIDEVMAITSRSDAPDGLSACLTMGRERGVGTWCATQRPTNVPLIVFTEANHFFAFRLRNNDDRDRVANYTDPQLRQMVPASDKFGFWYYSDDGGTRYYKSANVGAVAQQKAG